MTNIVSFENHKPSRKSRVVRPGVVSFSDYQKQSTTARIEELYRTINNKFWTARFDCHCDLAEDLTQEYEALQQLDKENPTAYLIAWMGRLHEEAIGDLYRWRQLYAEFEPTMDTFKDVWFAHSIRLGALLVGLEWSEENRCVGEEGIGKRTVRRAVYDSLRYHPNNEKLLEGAILAADHHRGTQHLAVQLEEMARQCHPDLLHSMKVIYRYAPHQ